MHTPKALLTAPSLDNCCFKKKKKKQQLSNGGGNSTLFKGAFLKSKM